MKKIHLNFVGFWSDFSKTNNMFYNILSQKFDVEISDNPDFLIVSPLCSPFEYMKYDCVRILFTGEPLVPNFNVFDYAIGFDVLNFPDPVCGSRYYRYPLCFYNIDRVRKCVNGLTYDEAKEALAAKKHFCNFIYGHPSAKGEREHLLKTVQTYKPVTCAGSFLNNMPNGEVIPYSEKKMEFLKLCKFTIACESISYPGFITEKIMNPFYSNSVPIYFGNPLSVSEFNSESIINCHEYPDFESALARVKEIDQNDELYLKTLMQPKLISDTYLEDIYAGLQEFLWSIFSQDKSSAYRRMRHYIQKEHELHLNTYRQIHGSFLYRVAKKLSRNK